MYLLVDRGDGNLESFSCSVCLGAGVPNICEEENVPLVA